MIDENVLKYWPMLIIPVLKETDLSLTLLHSNKGTWSHTK